MNYYTARLEKLRAAMKAKGCDAMLISEPMNQSWLCGFEYHDGYMLVTENNAYIITDSRYTEAARANTGKEFTVTVNATPAKVDELLKEEDAITLAFEDRSMSYASAVRLKEGVKAECVAAGGLLEDIREFKDASEFEAIRKAQELTDMAFDHILKVLTPEMTELDVAVELEFFLRKHGASGKSFDFITVSGEASSLPHGEPKDRKLRPGFLTMDFGCVYNGYCSDMTRTVCLGKADAEMKKLYNTVLEAQLAALAIINDGMKCADVDAAARRIIDKEYAGKFGHGLGHGVGKFIHEAPRLSPKAGDTVLRPGHVVTVEPGIYLEGKYGCRIEDMVFIHEGKAEDITHSPKELIELF
ncbi:MAG: aminopeptidase P family protein [Ruminococcaceae bacterium]|nr:aminopeptidase P family protein [Oscillospiraceae bacterium]